MGSCPRWYRVQSAARYLGVAPWVMEDAPWRYVLRAEAAQAAEAEAARVARERERRRQGMKR